MDLENYGYVVIELWGNGAGVVKTESCDTRRTSHGVTSFSIYTILDYQDAKTLKKPESFDHYCVKCQQYDPLFVPPDIFLVRDRPVVIFWEGQCSDYFAMAFAFHILHRASV